MPKFRITKAWEDLGTKWVPGDIVTISDTAYKNAIWQMKRYPGADLCNYGYWRIPLSHLEKWDSGGEKT